VANTLSAGLTDVGRRRKNNEDWTVHYEPEHAAVLREKGCLYIVADGVGGAAKGERASQFAAQTLLDEYYKGDVGPHPGDYLRRIINNVNSAIHSYAEENNTRMATTLVAGVVREGQLFLANVGDSRAYLIHGGQVKQLTHDHSIIGELVKSGEMTEAEAMASDAKNRLTRSLGGEPEVLVEVYPSLALKKGDRILFCTDGLTRYAAREDLRVMTEQGTPEEIAHRLIQFANGRGGVDNVTVLVVEYQGGEVLEPTLRLPQSPGMYMETRITQPDPSKINRGRRSGVAALITKALLVLVLAVVVSLMFLMDPQRTRSFVSNILCSISGVRGTPCTPTPTLTLAPTTAPVIPTEVPTDIPASIPSGENPLATLPSNVPPANSEEAESVLPEKSPSPGLPENQIRGRINDSFPGLPSCRTSTAVGEEFALCKLPIDSELSIIAKNADGTWLFVKCTCVDPQIDAWVYGGRVDVISGSIDDLPVK
jgi:protein phosphatase